MNLGNCLNTEKGFTLIEILVVIAILGIIVTFVVLNVDLRSRAKVVEQTANELLLLMQAAQQQAILQQQPMGISIQSDGYSFWQYIETSDSVIWQPIEQDNVFTPRHLPNGVHLRLTLLTTKADSASDSTAPSLVFAIDGTQAPYKLTISIEDNPVHYILAGQANGDLSLTRED